VVIKTHCPDLAEQADAHLQCVPDAIACWELYCDMGEFRVRLIYFQCNPKRDVSFRAR
jgi:hypothetical protein